MDFRAAKESELSLIWQVIETKDIFPSFDALRVFQEQNDKLIQVSAEGPSSIGVLGNWRSHLNVGAVKVAVAPDAYQKQLLEHLVSVLREEGFSEIVSPPLRLVDLRDFYEIGFRDFARIRIMKKTDFSSRPCPPPTIKIREFNLSQLSSLVQIEEEAFSNFWQYGEEELIPAIEAGHCFVAFFNGTIIGYNINITKDVTGTVARLAVLPRMQRRGFGSQLLSYSLKWFQAKKAKSMFITTQAANLVAQQLYAKFGFMFLDEDRYVFRLEP